MSKHTLLARLKEIGIVQKRQVQLSHAGQSDIYFNVKQAYGDPCIMQLIRGEIWKLIQKDMREQNKNVTVIAATEGVGGTPLASVLYIHYNKKLTIVREEQKKHGLEKQIEAYQPTKDDVVALVDDVGTTGKTLQKAANVLQTTGATILGAYALLKRGSVQLSMPFRCVFTAEELLAR